MDFNAAVIGYPVEHSLSPKIHNAVYEAFGIPWSYGIVSCPEGDDVRGALSSAKRKAMRAATAAEAMAGFNVTTPYKPLALELADVANMSAEIAGGANTLTFSELCDERACRAVVSADSTDGEGACRALEKSGAPIEGSRILVLGTGAAALSIVASAVFRGASEVRVASRSPQRAQGLLDGICARVESALCDDRLWEWGFAGDRRPVGAQALSIPLRAIGYDEAPAFSRSADIVVNGTPVGMGEQDGSPLSGDAFCEGQVVLDAIYAHGQTRFVSDALAAGARAFDGLGMLVEQALLSMSVWLSQNGFDVDPLSAKAYEAIRRAGIELAWDRAVADADDDVAADADDDATAAATADADADATAAADADAIAAD